MKDLGAPRFRALEVANSHFREVETQMRIGQPDNWNADKARGPHRVVSRPIRYAGYDLNGTFLHCPPKLPWLAASVFGGGATRPGVVEAGESVDPHLQGVHGGDMLR